MNKSILVTGASSGIGKSVAQYLSQCGYTVILVARRESVLLELQKELPNESYIMAYDLENISDIKSIFDFCKEQNIKLDGMVHSAGITIDNQVRTIDMDDVIKVVKVNYLSFIELGKYFSMKKYSNEGASIVAISSTASHMGQIATCAYSSSKAAVNGAVRVMAKEFMRRKIRVNAVLPAYVDTPLIDDLKEKEIIGNSQYLGLGLIEPIHVSYLVEFLLSDKAKYISGSEIPITSGLCNL